MRLITVVILLSCASQICSFNCRISSITYVKTDLLKSTIIRESAFKSIIDEPTNESLKDKIPNILTISRVVAIPPFINAFTTNQVKL